MDALTEPHLELTAFVQLCLGGDVVAEYEIRSPVVSVGRSSDCDIVIDNAAVSAFHAVLSQNQGRLLVEDAASTNGVMANGTKKPAVELSPGQSVDIAGKYSVKLVKRPIGVPLQVRARSSVSNDDQKATVMVETATMARLSQNARPAFLTLTSDGKRSWLHRLEKSSVVIGGSRAADIQISGWFKPSRLAEIERRDDGYYLVVQSGRELEVDGKPFAGECRLAEGARFRTGQLSGVFHESAGAPRSA